MGSSGDGWVLGADVAAPRRIEQDGQLRPKVELSKLRQPMSMRESVNVPARPVMDDPRRKILAGAQLRRLRLQLGLSQTAMAAELGISVSYLNLVERNGRPLTAQLLIRLSETYAIDPRDFAGGEDGHAAAEFDEVLADPLLASLEVPRAEMRAALDEAPTLVQALKRLHAAYAGWPRLRPGRAGARPSRRRGRWPGGRRRGGAGADLPRGERQPFPRPGGRRGGAERGAGPVEGDSCRAARGCAPGTASRVRSCRTGMGVTLRHYDRHRRKLMISELLEPAGRTFQAAYQIGLLEAGAAIDATLEGAGRRTRSRQARADHARQLLRGGPDDALRAFLAAASWATTSSCWARASARASSRWRIA